MIALVKFSDETPKKRVSRRTASDCVRCVSTVRFGMRTLELTLRRSLAKEQLVYDAAAELLKSRGFREAVCQCATPIAAELAVRGIAQPPVSRVERAAVAETAICALNAVGAGSVGVYARRRSRELERTVRLLGARVRSLCVVVERGGEAYARELMYDYGLSVSSSVSALRSAELKILFDRPGFSVGAGAAVGTDLPSESGLAAVRPAGYDLPEAFCQGAYPPLELASAAVAQGVLRPGDIGICRLRFVNSIDNSNIHLYNAIWNPEKDER